MVNLNQKTLDINTGILDIQTFMNLTEVTITEDIEDHFINTLNLYAPNIITNYNPTSDLSQYSYFIKRKLKTIIRKDVPFLLHLCLYKITDEFVLNKKILFDRFIKNSNAIKNIQFIRKNTNNSTFIKSVIINQHYMSR